MARVKNKKATTPPPADLNPDPNRTELMKVLAYHGFTEAVKGFQKEWINYRRAITSWEDYPQCMAKYPAQRRK